MKVGVIDYGMGNKASILNSLKYIGFETTVINSYKTQIKDIKVLILPGVGAFDVAMNNLKRRGLDDLIYNHVQKERKIIGICLGMQLFFDVGNENKQFNGLGLIQGRVTKFEKIKRPLPHVGWTYCDCLDDKYSSDYYFVHSYKCEPNDKNLIYMKSNYGINFCSSVRKGNIIGFQFHPEKSQTSGLKLLKDTISYND